MPLIWDTDTIRIDLPDGEWIDIKPPSAGDRAYAMRRATHVSGRPFAPSDNDSAGAVAAMENVEMTMDLAAFNFALAERCFKAWSFKLPNGDPAPITPENIERLDESSWEVVTQKFNELTGRRSEAEKKGSRRSS